MKMRRVLAARGADGRSFLAADGRPVAVYRFGGERGNLDPHELRGSGHDADRRAAADGEVVVADLWRTSAADPLGLIGGGATDGFDVECPPGATTWRVVEMGPNRVAPRHQTETIDYDLVLAGEVELILDEGAVLLTAGDAVVLPAVAHGWRTGSRPCTLTVMQVGAGPDAGSSIKQPKEDEG